jgi:predicted amidohydrolase
VVVLPEAALTGYFLQGGVQELAISADRLASELEAVLRSHWPAPLDLVVGYFEADSGLVYNSSSYFSFDSQAVSLLHTHRKIFLPTYGIFDEGRFVSHGGSVQAFETRLGRSAMLICEDAWHSVSATLAALEGAELLYLPVASPLRGLAGEEPSNITRWRQITASIAQEHSMFVISSNLVGVEAGKCFGGCSLAVHPDGHALVEGPFLEEAILLSDLDLTELRELRYRNPLLGDLQRTWPILATRVPGPNRA